MAAKWQNEFPFLVPVGNYENDSACGANYPYQALKGGYFVFVWRVLT